MADRIKNSNHTGKSQHRPITELTLDSNMVGYLYLLTKTNPSPVEYVKLKSALTQEQKIILDLLVDNNFEGIRFKTTPQVIEEVTKCAKLKGDDGIVRFLESICKIRIPRGKAEKIKYAEIIADLMEEYLREDIPLPNNVRAFQSAISTEIKKGEENFADAKIVAENTVLNGNPIITRNEKHLISMEGFHRRNNLRSEAIIDKNIKVLKNPKHAIPHKGIVKNLKNLKCTTFRINEIYDLLEK